jgi:hypothetical protein
MPSLTSEFRAIERGEVTVAPRQRQPNKRLEDLGSLPNPPRKQAKKATVSVDEIKLLQDAILRKHQKVMKKVASLCFCFFFFFFYLFSRFFFCPFIFPLSFSGTT